MLYLDAMISLGIYNSMLSALFFSHLIQNEKENQEMIINAHK